ncbi:hypothetical protein AMECASPLE_013800 [Ameca splendens]|uniref:Uncharacterized protein n=1 Tax=Ameca splendens TaxID=208324 RepID=A0ABV0ZL77_9TELE
MHLIAAALNTQHGSWAVDCYLQETQSKRRVLLRPASLGATGVPHFDDHLEEYIRDGSPALLGLSVLPTAVPYSVF